MIDKLAGYSFAAITFIFLIVDSAQLVSSLFDFGLFDLN